MTCNRGGENPPAAVDIAQRESIATPCPRPRWLLHDVPAMAISLLLFFQLLKSKELVEVEIKLNQLSQVIMMRKELSFLNKVVSFLSVY